MNDTPKAKATSEEQGMPAFQRSRRRAYSDSEGTAMCRVCIDRLDDSGGHDQPKRILHSSRLVFAEAHVQREFATVRHNCGIDEAERMMQASWVESWFRTGSNSERDVRLDL